jgi:antitoxin component YwqK of YwqJK toxin-antitoxin module
MLRATNLITSLTLGLALACEASALEAQGAPKQTRKVDYVVEIPADDSGEYQSQESQDEVAQPIEEQPAEESMPESTDSAQASEGHETDEQVSEEPVEPQDETESIKERFPNGTVKIERSVTQDAQGNYVNHGAWKEWDQQGNLVAQGQYEYGNRVGTWIRWYRSVTEAKLLTAMPYKQFAGPFISQATFANDQIDGVWTIYDGKTRKISQWSFAEGKRNGPSIWWYPNGKKMREAHFERGDMDGEYLEWNPDGSVKTKENYEGGRKLALKTSYYTGNVKKSEGMYLFAKDVEHTPDDWWTCKLLTTVKSGKDEKHGPWQSWFTNGGKQLEGNYEHDLQVGQFTWWHSNGQKALQGTFKHGKQDGTWTWWHANGQKSIEGQYATGNPTGRWTWWKEDGRVVQSADLSHSEGVVIDMPRELEQPPAAPRTGRPAQRQPVKR